MRIVFRTDASDAIGTGHLMRCLTLADAAATEGHICTFVMREHPGRPEGLVEARGHALVVLPSKAGFLGEDDTGGPSLDHADWLGASQAVDARQTAAAVGDGYDWLVADHYALDHRWESSMRAAGGGRIMTIDDLADRLHDCDLLLDQNLQGSAGRYAGLVPAGCQTLIGPRHALLRPEFAALAKEIEGPRALQAGARVLVYFGGIDPDGATLVVLEGLGALDKGLAVDVVAGARNPHLAAIREAARRMPDTRLFEGNADMPALMAGASLAIGAAGATAWERCCLALPTILITIAENQKPGAAALADAGAALWLGDVGEVTPGDVARSVAALTDDPVRAAALGETARSLCDGAGAGRVLAALSAPRTRLRLAAPDDCETVFAWRNHPDTRRFFHDPAPVAIADHRAWFARTIADPDRRLWIGEEDSGATGVVRFDRDADEASALISVYLVPGEGGRGAGARLIAAGCAEAAAGWPGLTAIDAEILPENIASAGAFAKAGFVPYGARDAHRWRLTLPRGARPQ